MRVNSSLPGCGHDSSGATHDGFSSGAVTHRTARQPQHMRLVCTCLPAFDRIRQQLHQSCALATATGTTGRSADRELPESPRNDPWQWRWFQKHPAGGHQILHALHGISCPVGAGADPTHSGHPREEDGFQACPAISRPKRCNRFWMPPTRVVVTASAIAPCFIFVLLAECGFPSWWACESRTWFFSSSATSQRFDPRQRPERTLPAVMERNGIRSQSVAVRSRRIDSSDLLPMRGSLPHENVTRKPRGNGWGDD